ncbi:hypothetical protein NB722_001374 [Xanthomonas sacchari]|uniref:hypothetical protein n=1 Tax=Xanthomonas sacchari TaxID=56458 RepID=UPI0022557562|nr:hypothetical protein [Xanthomonas sacchari]MCW0386835.1 hypothetical protein [Xanthomonas sacchari]
MTESQAYSACQAQLSSAPSPHECYSPDSNSMGKCYQIRFLSASGTWDNYGGRYCPDQDGPKCAGLPNISGAQSWSGSSSATCSAGCGYESVGSSLTFSVAGKLVTYTDASGLKPTGAACAAGDSQLNAAKKEDCIPVTGQTICVRPDGSVCATATNGKQLCWQSRETGTKTTGDTLADRQAGTQHTPPSLQIPSGDTLTKVGGPDTVQTTTKNPDGSSSTVTTNVTSYKTDNGTDAGGSDQSEGKDKDGKSASGGGDCKTPPVVSGDQALAMVATQTWATRCAVEAGNATKVTGDIGDCKSAFTVEGDNAQAHELRALRAERCGESPAWVKPKSGEGSNGDPYGGSTDGKDGPGTWSLKVDSRLLDTSGFLGGSCPTLGTLDFGRFGQVSLDGTTWWCPLIAAMRAVMLLMGAFIAVRLLLGD